MTLREDWIGQFNSFATVSGFVSGVSSGFTLRTKHSGPIVCTAEISTSVAIGLHFESSHDIRDASHLS